MFDGLKSIFGSKTPKQARPTSASKPAPPKPRLKKVNIARKFAIVGEIGAGSMSRVYRAVDNENGRVVCLKVQDAAKTTAAMARSHQANRPTEGEIGIKIVHPNVVRTLDFGLTPRNDYFIVMEFIEGVSLTLCRDSRPLRLEDKLAILAQASQSLEAMHAAGFIHHDFGPKNLLVTAENQVKLIDFGLSVPNTAEFRRPGNRTGTLSYMAPELIRREPKDEKIDLFAWGVTAFEFLTGRQPYDINPDLDAMAALRMRMNSTPMPLARVAPHMPPEVCAIIDKALAKRPADRWPTAAGITRAIHQIIGSDEDTAEDDDRAFDW
jgi:serine/threonine protein kinase